MAPLACCPTSSPSDAEKSAFRMALGAARPRVVTMIPSQGLLLTLRYE